PCQSEAAWMAELERAVALAGEHISVYQLTIEQNTAFAAAYRRGGFTLPPEERGGRVHEITQDRPAGAGPPAHRTPHPHPAGARNAGTIWCTGKAATMSESDLAPMAA